MWQKLIESAVKGAIKTTVKTVGEGYQKKKFDESVNRAGHPFANIDCIFRKGDGLAQFQRGQLAILQDEIRFSPIGKRTVFSANKENISTRNFSYSKTSWKEYSGYNVFNHITYFGFTDVVEFNFGGDIYRIAFGPTGIKEFEDAIAEIQS